MVKKQFRKVQPAEEIRIGRPGAPGLQRLYRTEEGQRQSSRFRSPVGLYSCWTS
jgi:hypothetical protein